MLALVGPPGVGKTSLGESVARASDRKFVRVALGGVHDEAEIRGHRRTYVGALPGGSCGAIEAGSMNPVVLLDEVDKIGADFRGDPAGALLEVSILRRTTRSATTTSSSNSTFHVLFLATANVADTMPAALLDRMEVVRLDGYTEDEKSPSPATTCCHASCSMQRWRPTKSCIERRRAARSSPASTPEKPASDRWNNPGAGAAQSGDRLDRSPESRRSR